MKSLLSIGAGIVSLLFSLSALAATNTNYNATFYLDKGASKGCQVLTGLSAKGTTPTQSLKADSKGYDGAFSYTTAGKKYTFDINFTQQFTGGGALKTAQTKGLVKFGNMQKAKDNTLSGTWLGNFRETSNIYHCTGKVVFKPVG